VNLKSSDQDATFVVSDVLTIVVSAAAELLLGPAVL
jgi:hypothetical protein